MEMIPTSIRFELACVASISVALGSKETPKNGIFGVLPAQKMGREPKNERGGWGRVKQLFTEGDLLAA